MKKLPIYFCLSILALTGCSKEDDDTTPTPTTPTNTLKSGSVFTFQRTDFDSQTGTTVVATTQYTITLAKDTTINGEKWFWAERKDAAGSQYGVLKFTTNGMFSLNKSGATVPMFKFPAAVNDTWVDQNDQTCKVISTNQSVTVPAGTYNNAYYMESSDANSLENKMWYNDKEYLLKNEEYDESPVTPGTMIIDYRDELVKITY